MCVCDYKLACKSDDFFSEGKKCRTKIQKKEASPVKVISVLLASFWSPILSETKKGENRKLNNNLTLLKPFCTTWDYIRLFMWSLSTIISRLCDKSIFAELMCNHRCHSRWLKIAEKSLTLQNCERSELLLHFGKKSLKVPKMVNLRSDKSILLWWKILSRFLKSWKGGVGITIGSETNMHKKWPGFTSSRIPGDFCIWRVVESKLERGMEWTLRDIIELGRDE